MTTHHLRHRRLLSMSRRAGLQIELDVAQGRTQRQSRHALIEHETEAANDDFSAYRPARITDPPWTVVDVIGTIALVALLATIVTWAVLVGTGEIGSMLAGLRGLL